MITNKIFSKLCCGQIGLTVLLLAMAPAQSWAQSYTILHHFGTNQFGTSPHSALVPGPEGVFYGTTEKGGFADSGQVFKVNADGTGYTVLKDFAGQDGAGPQAALLLVGTTLYGTAAAGGISNYGTVFKLNTDGTGFAVLKTFHGYDGATPYSALVLSGNTLYGTTYAGGTSNVGTIFKLGTDGSGFGVLRAFLGADGAHPGAGLCLSPASVLYGTTVNGPVNGNVFALNLDGTGFTVLKAFEQGLGGPCATLLLSGGTLYGSTLWSTNAGLGGSIFKINIDGSGFNVLKQFVSVDPGTWPDGAWPDADMVLAGDALYGSAYSGGASNCGAVFTIKTDGSGFNVIKSFTQTEKPSGHPNELQWRSGLCLWGGTLYGTMPQGGPGSFGSLFELNTDGTGFAVLQQFAGGDGEQPYSGVAQGQDGALYGTARMGGGTGSGMVFKLNPDGSGYSTLKVFNGIEGGGPEAGVLVSGATLYGSTTSGGVSNSGTLFKMNTDGSGFTVLRSCLAYNDGVYPNTVPVISGSTLYGGIDYGKVYHINTDGTGYGYYSVDQSGGIQQSVLLDGSTIYGAEMEGGPSYGDGMVFKINTDGSGFTILKVMGGTDGRWPNGPLVLSGKTLYGTAYGGGNNYCGTVFKVNTDGTGFAVLKQFTGGSDGSFPYSGMVLNGDTLYGTTGWSQSGVNQGTVFKIKTNGTGFTVIKTFNGPDGRIPYGNLVLSRTNLYGTTIYGGVLDKGTLFKINVEAVLPVIVSSPRSQTVEVGGNASFSARAIGTSPLAYQLFFNATTLVGISPTPLLLLPNVQFSQAGAYTIVVTNVFGAATSSPAMLNVITPVERRPVPRIDFTGVLGSAFTIQSAGDLNPPSTWSDLASLTMTGASQTWFDLTVPLPEQRFYRAVEVPGRTPQVLNLVGMVPALTLTGTVGGAVRVEGINAFGPTDAWFTLDTVTLTNTSQLYFDVSAAGQPQRLYRLTAIP